MHPYEVRDTSAPRATGWWHAHLGGRSSVLCAWALGATQQMWDH